ncbi:MAG TPA: hypothetical protein VM639_21040 [Dongiaceae bacterium]|nr:hypothetical protein [Dongiaceae bacterium]
MSAGAGPVKFAFPLLRRVSRRHAIIGGAAFIISRSLPAAADEEKPDATVDIEQVQIAFIGSGNLGGGKLHFQGKTYPFTVGGLGIGGIGISKMQAIGSVYSLKRLADFPGAYVQGRYGVAVGGAGSGELWLKNPSGVEMLLKTKRQGLALSLGGDAVYIDLD